MTWVDEEVGIKVRDDFRGLSLGERYAARARSAQDTNAEAVAADRLTLKTVRENLDESQGIYLLYGSAEERSVPQRSDSVSISP